MISPHPSLKPQAFMRQIVRASLPLGKGIVLDPFTGGGSTIAAAISTGYDSVGIEVDPQYFGAALDSIPLLAALPGSGRLSGRLGSKGDSELQRSLALPLEP